MIKTIKWTDSLTKLANSRNKTVIKFMCLIACFLLCMHVCVFCVYVCLLCKTIYVTCPTICCLLKFNIANRLRFCTQFIFVVVVFVLPLLVVLMRYNIFVIFHLVFFFLLLTFWHAFASYCRLAAMSFVGGSCVCVCVCIYAFVVI